MTGTVTHGMAQNMNDTIRPYLDSTYMIQSSDQFLMEIHQQTILTGEHLVSLDVESLFTNVPFS
jgi:hypothetical protein